MFIHGEPGTGKSRVIQWVRRFFMEALKWAHEREFLFGAYQNTVAHAMGGSTLHTGGDILVGAPGEEKMNHTDVDVLFTRNQCLRWIVID